MRFFCFFLVLAVLTPVNAFAGERIAESCTFTGTLGACSAAGVQSLLCLYQEDFDHELPIQCTGNMAARCDELFGETVRLRATLHLFALDIIFEATRIVPSPAASPQVNRCHLEGELNELFTPDADIEQFYHLYKIEAHRNLDVLCPEGVNSSECIPRIDEQVELNSHVIMGAEGPVFVVHQLDC